MCKNLIICHGDADGIISAAVIIRKYGFKLDNNVETKVIITQPFLLDRLVIKDDVKAIFVLDIAVNKHDVDMTRHFANKYSNRIISWIDHHPGTEKHLEAILTSRLTWDDNERSCPALMKKAGYEIPNTWLQAANACDRPMEYSATDLSQRYNKAFKVALVESQEGDRNIVEKIQRAFLEELLTGEKLDFLTDYRARYEPLLKATQRAAANFTKFLPGVGIVLLDDERVDKNLLCLQGYELFETLIIQFHSLENGEPMTMVTTSNKEINLLQLFNLPRGPLFRVILKGRLSETKKMIKEKLS